MSTQQTTSRGRSQRGITLIELMVALMLGLLLTGGVIQIFLSNREAYAFNEGLSRLQENGRFSMDTLSFHARMAGYLGCLSGSAVTNNLNATQPLAFDFTEGLFGYEAAGTGPDQTFAPTGTNPNPANSSSAADWSPGLDPALVGDAIPGSDILIVRHASAESHTLLSTFSDADYVYVDALTSEYAVGDIGVVSDCQKASIFQVTSVGGGTPGIKLGHTVGSLVPGNVLGSWDTDQQYVAGAEMRRAESWIYYVGARSAGGPPALFQRRLQIDGTSTSVDFVAEELVEGIDTMQILYGIDPGLDGAVNEYVTADVVGDWNEVVALRVALLMRAPNEYGTERDTQAYDVNETQFDPVDDRRVREVFTTTIAIRNRLP